MTDLSKIRARLQALRNMTVDRGCTEAEALAAAAKAAELLAANNLTEADLDTPVYDELAIALGKRRTPLDSIWKAVATFADCRGWLCRRGDRWHYVYFGRESDVLVAEYVHEVIRRACDTAVAAFRRSETYQRRRTAKTRSAAMKAFLEGFGRALVEKIGQGLWRRYCRQVGEDRALEAIRANGEALSAALAARGVRLQGLRPIARSTGRFRDEARRAGVWAGRDVSIDAAVAASGTSTVAGLLS
jgi:hypothetical protein